MLRTAFQARTLLSTNHYISSTARQVSVKMSSTSCNEKLYELRKYSVRPGNLKRTLELCSEAMPVRFRHSPCLGYWQSEVGGLNELIHIWEYEGYGQRAAVRKSLGADQAWIEKGGPMIAMFERQDNATMKLMSWSRLNTDVKPGGAFFLYQFTFLPRMSTEAMSIALETFVSQSGCNAIGIWKEEVGSNSLRTAYGLFHAPDLDSPKNLAKLDPVVWESLRETTETIHGRILSATAFSPIK